MRLRGRPQAGGGEKAPGGEERTAGTGAPLPRPDAADKASGRALFLADLPPLEGPLARTGLPPLEGLLHALTLRSTRPKARMLEVRIPPLPPETWIVDHRDVPGRNRVKMTCDDQPFFAEEVVRYVGEPILLLVGPDRGELRRILEAIEVRYENLDPAFSLEEAEARADSCLVSYQLTRGDPAAAFRRAAAVVEEEYRTGAQEHAYLEPQGFIGLTEGGRITVYGSMQCPYFVKSALVEGLGWAPERVRVVQTVTGGGFGGKEDYPSLLAGQVAFAALKTGRPVRLVLDRGEDIRATTKRHPSRIRFRTALDGRQEILGMEIEILLDGGAYSGLSPVVLQRSMFSATGVYAIPNARVEGKVLATNNLPTGAFRGFGAPQAFFAIESHMHSLALRAGREPLEFKLAHRVKRGEATITGGTFRQEVKLAEMAAAVEEMSGYRRKTREYEEARGRGSGPWRGIGISLFSHGCGFTGSGERDLIKGRVTLRKLRDGRVEILAASADMGQGPQAALRKIAARTLGFGLERVLFDNPDTDRVPDSGPTVASRTAMIVGRLVQQAAKELKASWDTAPELEVSRSYEQPGFVRWDQQAFKGDAYPAFAWGVNAVEVEVDPLTFEPKVRGVWGAYDIGEAIDEKIIQGQIEGGVAQALGWASLEVLEAREGRLLQANLTDYIIPTSMDFPRIQFRLFSNPYEYGPFGAKGAGELPFVGAAPALAAAVSQALGRPVRRLPITPEALMELAADEA